MKAEKNDGRSLELEDSLRLANENIKDIIAVGFDPSSTFIFSDFEYMGGAFYKNVIRIQRCAASWQLGFVITAASCNVSEEPLLCLRSFLQNMKQSCPCIEN